MYKKSAKMNDLQKEKWEKTRSSGLVKYVLLQGILLRGTIFVLLMYFYNIAFETIWARWYDLPYEPPSEHWETKILSGVIFGIIFGLGTWSENEKKYLKS